MRMKLGWLVFACGAQLLAAAEAEGTLISARAAAFNPNNGKTYLVDARHDALWILNAAAKSSVRVAVGKAPSAVAVDARRGRVYVADSGDGTVTVVDGQADRVTTKVKAGPHPYVLAVNDATGKVYVTNTFSDLVAEIDGASNSVEMLKLGSADGVAVDRNTNKVFLIGYEGADVKVLDGRTHVVRTANVGEHMWGIAVSEKTGTVYVTRVGAAELVAVDEETLSVKRAHVGEIQIGRAHV